MARPHLAGATAAAMLPAAVAAAALVSAPFAGTTTAPLADHTKVPARSAPTAPAAQTHVNDNGLNFSIPKSGVAMLAGGELLLLGVGAGVIVVARRRRFADD